MTTEIWSQAVLLGGWFGLLHAFDADHLATIGGLALRDRSLPATGYALRWALGHAVALGIVRGVCARNRRRLRSRLDGAR